MTMMFRKNSLGNASPVDRTYSPTSVPRWPMIGKPLPMAPSTSLLINKRAEKAPKAFTFGLLPSPMGPPKVTKRHGHATIGRTPPTAVGEPPQ